MTRTPVRAACLGFVLTAWMAVWAGPAAGDDLPYDPLAFERRYTGELPWWMIVRPEFYQKFSYHHGAFATHHQRPFWYVEGRHHGYPFGHSHYQPRFPGMSYTFEHWGPPRSWYYPWSPGYHYQPYGFSPEPYYAR